MPIDYQQDFGDKGLAIGRKTNVLIPFTKDILPVYSSLRIAACYAVKRDQNEPIEETRENSSGDNSIYFGVKTEEKKAPYTNIGNFYGLTNENNDEIRIVDNSTTWDLYSGTSNQLGFGKVIAGNKTVNSVTDGLDVPTPSDVSVSSSFNRVLVIDFITSGSQLTLSYQKTGNMADVTARQLRNRIRQFSADGSVAPVSINEILPSFFYVSWPFVKNKLILYSILIQGKR